METNKPAIKFRLFFCIGLLSVLLLLSGCTAVIPSTNESQITQVISNFFKAINDINREKALSYTISNGPAYDMTNKFFDNKVPLAEQNNTQYEYTFDIQTISILNDTTASVELTYSFKLLGTTGLVSPTFNGNFTLQKVNETWLLDTAPFAN
jgi:hypothetical protein